MSIDEIVILVLLLIVVAAAVVLPPLAFIWSLNTLFALYIPYTFTTWVASFVFVTFLFISLLS